MGDWSWASLAPTAQDLNTILFSQSFGVHNWKHAYCMHCFVERVDASLQMYFDRNRASTLENGLASHGKGPPRDGKVELHILSLKGSPEQGSAPDSIPNARMMHRHRGLLRERGRRSLHSAWHVVAGRLLVC